MKALGLYKVAKADVKESSHQSTADHPSFSFLIYSSVAIIPVTLEPLALQSEVITALSFLHRIISLWVSKGLRFIRKGELNRFFDVPLIMISGGV
ncbi:MAG: hypothetical protein VKK04_16550 [Synechococcales bacterium]|nr:hypothetical protein [Synechococcales bacterium]